MRLPSKCNVCNSYLDDLMCSECGGCGEGYTEGTLCSSCHGMGVTLELYCPVCEEEEDGED